MPAKWIDLPFLEAVRFLRSLAPTSREVFDEMSVEARSRAFTVAHVSKMGALQDVLDALAGAAESGMTLSEFVDAFEPLGLSEAHLETIFRTNLQSAFGRGSYEKLTDPALGGALWGWRYGTVGDDRVRESHAALDGLTFEKNAHPEIYPPWSWNCRCSAEPITRREARENDYVSASLPAEVQEDLASSEFTSPALGIEYQADLGSFDLGLVSEFLNDQGGPQ
jgi:hypothetical protein